MDEANGLLPNDQLTLFCEVSVVQDSVNIHGHSQRPKLIVPDCTLTTDLSNLLRDQTFSDVKFDVHGEEFAAHKAIMAARSEVFRCVTKNLLKAKKQNHNSLFSAMFATHSNFAEAQNGSVKIVDVEKDVFR